MRGKKVAGIQVAIKTPPLKAAPATICDWVELSAVANKSKFFRFSALKRFWDTHRETEGSDPEGHQRREDDTDDEGVGGPDDDVFLDSITGELEDRAYALGESYPFEMDSDGRKLSLKAEMSEGAYIYLFCLILSNSKQGEILDGSWLPDITHKTRDLFQACATLAAAGEVNGSAISFGWPRPDNNPPFLIRLRDVYRLFGEGHVVRAPRLGVSPSPKDEEIDIIAWRPTADGAAGTEYLLGQVASGENWEAKSIKGAAIDSFHHNWFNQAPASVARASIFIPREIQSWGEGSRRDRMNVQTAKYGTIFDRLRLPSKATDGIKLADSIEDGNRNIVIERRTDVPAIIAWVDKQITNLQTKFLERV